MKCYSAIAKAVSDQGVDTIFGVLGDANLFMVDSFVREYDGRFIASSNEAGATLMALGYAAVSGRIGVATVTLGPGLSNTVSALLEGVRGAAPMVLVCGDTGVEERDEISRISQREFVTLTGAGFEQLRSPGTLSDDVATAFWRARVERRPIALNVPRDFQWDEVSYRAVVKRVPDGRAIVPTSADLDDAVGIIATAKRPLIIAGRGAIQASARAAIIRLAARIEAPLATTMTAKDRLRGEPNNIGVFGTMSSREGVDAILASDCIIAFGASLNPYTTSRGTFLRGKRVIQINLEQTEVGKHVSPDAGVVGDPELVADTIVRWLNTVEAPPSGYMNELNEGRAARSVPDEPFKSPPAGKLSLSAALRRINEAVPEDRVLVTDGGRFLSRAWVDLDVRDPRYFVFTLNFGSIGMGLSEAIGASLASEGRPTLLITGDGGFMLGGLAEFNTAVRSRCDLVVVVCNDGCYGAEHIQFRAKDMDPSISQFDWPDFAPVAEALGGTGVTVRTMQDLELAVTAIEGRKGPVLIDLKLDPDDMPQLPH